MLPIHDSISLERNVAYLLGDYNINLLDLSSQPKINDFMDSVISQGYTPHITKPTRVTLSSATLIHHLYSNHHHPTYESGVIITDVADHFWNISFNIWCLWRKKVTHKYVRQLKNTIFLHLDVYCKLQFTHQYSRLQMQIEHMISL